MASSAADSLARMRSMIADLPAMVVEGFRLGREIAWPLEVASAEFA